MLIKRFFIVFLCLFLASSPLYALDDVPPPVPVTAVDVEKLPLPDKEPKKTNSIDTGNISKEENTEILFSEGNIKDGIIVLELFSKQNCPACLKADAVIEPYRNNPDIIALSCHISSLHKKEKSSFSLPFCNTRHAAYKTALRDNIDAIPRIIVNGRHSTIAKLSPKQAVESPPTRAEIMSEENEPYEIALPELPALQDNQSYKIWLMVYDKPHKTEEVTYYNIVSKVGFLGKWNGAAKKLKFNPKLEDKSKGFAILVHHPESEHIVAAAKYSDF